MHEPLYLASQLKFHIEPKTLQSIKENAERIQKIDALLDVKMERWMELDEISATNN